MLIVRQNATHKVTLGPAVAVGDGFTPVQTLTLAGADEAEVILHDNVTVVDISGYTMAAVTTAHGYYQLVLQTGITSTIGHMTVVINDDSLILPLRADFTIMEEVVYDKMYATSADGPLQSVDAASPLDVTATGAAGINWGNVENQGSTVDLSATDIQLVDTATTVTNQLTAAAIATGIWTDTTAGDFTTASSVGKSIMNGVALGTGLTINAYTGNTVQTGNTYSLAAGSTGFTAIDTVVDAIQVVTDKFVFTVANQVDANMIAVSGGTTAADNLQLMYDGTGYTDVTGPSSRSQVDGLGAASGGSVNIQVTSDNVTTDTIDAAGAVDKGGGTVGIPVTGHAFIAGSEVTIAGTTNYNGAFTIVSQTANEVVITSSFVSETFGGSETIVSSIKSITFVGSVQSGTFASTEAEDGILHDIDDTANDIDIVYGFSVGGGRTAAEISFAGFAQGITDELKVKVYDHVGDDWEIIGTVSGQVGTSNITLDLPLLLKHTGTGSELGNVYIRFDTDTTTPSNLSVDRLLISAVNIGQTVGYSNGSIWVDTTNGISGSEPFVNGVADSPCSSWANVKSLVASIGISDIHVINGSSLTLDATVDNYSFFGDNWNLALGGQSIASLYAQGATVSGIGTASSTCHFSGCNFTTASIQLGHFDKCGFSGTITQTLAGDYHYHNCYSRGDASPIFSKTSGQALVMETQNWAGNITVSGLESGDTVELGGFFRTIILSGSGGTVHVHGHYEAISSGSFSGTLEIVGAIKTEDVAAILVDTGTTIPATLATMPTVSGSGTAESGTTLTLVDTANRTEADTDYWRGCWVKFTSGTLSGQVRMITGFNTTSDTLTFAPATTVAVGTHTYDILPSYLAIDELTSVPGANPTINEAVALMYMALRNKVNVTTSGTDELEIHTDGDVKIGGKVLTDAAGDYSEAKLA